MAPCPVRAIVRTILAAVVSACLLGTPAGAMTSAGAPPPDSQARELFQKAEMSFNLGRFADALTDYQGAYESKPLPAFLFNIAQCYRNMQNYERARFFYRRYLALDPHTANRHLVEELIAEMTRVLDKGGDGRAGGPAAVGSDAAPTVNLAAAEPAAPAPAASSSSSSILVAQADASASPQSARPIYKRWWFWAGIGAVAAGAVIAGVIATRPDTPQGSLGTINGR